ncbi:MAG: DegV family protein [Clostridiales bacterium]|nr:DegV family protein [Clostridiales bacterium]
MAADYIIFTDSACDILPEKLREWDVELMLMSYLFTDDGKERLDHDQPMHEFYNEMRNGRVAKTSSLNEDVIVAAFQPVLEAGKDILYLAFSSGLSATCEHGKNVAESLGKKYPDRKIRVVDSLAASAGQGLFVCLGKENRDKGMSLDENADALTQQRLHVCHWFTVEDLKYLKRGGRVSAATALLGTALNVKPVLHVDNEGHLIKMTQVHGRKKSIRTMADKLAETALEETPIFISHGDCLDDAQKLQSILEEEFGRKVNLITGIGSLIGAHSGPGTLALFFLGRQR